MDRSHDEIGIEKLKGECYESALRVVDARGMDTVTKLAPVSSAGTEAAHTCRLITVQDSKGRIGVLEWEKASMLLTRTANAVCVAAVWLSMNFHVSCT